MVKWEVVGSYKKQYNIMERACRNTHEQVYLDMSIIVIDIKKSYCIGKHMDCGVLPSLRSS